MPIFAKNKSIRVQGLILKLVNTNCPGLGSQLEDERLDNRVNLSLVVMVVPIEEGKIQPDRAFTAVTKDFASMGVSIVMEPQPEMEQAIVGFRMEGEMTYVLAEAKHLHSMGGGLCQLGFRLLEVVPAGDYPGLGSLSF
jgi:hypothetical protein